MKSFLLLFLISISATVSAQSLTKEAFEKQTQLHRTDYKQDFLKDERSPFHKNPEGLDQMEFYESKLEYRCDCSFERTPDAKPFLMATYSGKTRDYIQYGQLNCKIDQQDIQIAVYRNLMMVRMPHYRNQLFIPFKDLTNGKSTYGGGRYIDIETTDIKDNQVTIDFNKCYNPWCAFADGYNCPIPPQENHLDIAIEAGEKTYPKEAH